MRLLTFLAGLLFLLILVACRQDETSAPPAASAPILPRITVADLPDMGPAPEILNEVWLNAEEPYTIASQRGKVVLLKFWTFG
ncbi:MAG: hypothetical protein KDE09_18870 [Anaerolineales bacterium]|nr:hypothetical protein [Anaerolineales bacterium]MCB8962410.1 hypothetical protein [Ardenticatenales bacterium]